MLRQMLFVQGQDQAQTQGVGVLVNWKTKIK